MLIFRDNSSNNRNLIKLQYCIANDILNVGMRISIESSKSLPDLFRDIIELTCTGEE